MTAKDKLRQIRRYDKKADEALRNLESVQADLTRITPRYGGAAVMSSDVADLSGGVARLIEAGRKADEAADSYAEAKALIVEMLLEIEDPDECKVLRLRYLDYRSNPGWRYTTWETIAEQLNRSKRGVTALHGAALQSFEKIMKTWFEVPI